MRRGEGRCRTGAALAALLAFAFCALVPPPALAAHHGAASGGGAAAPAKAAHKKPPAKEVEGPPAPLPSPTAKVGTLARELGTTGTVDPITGLGLRNPACDQPNQIRSRSTRLSCEVNGTPESNYPSSNYGFDIFISTGITHPVGDIMYCFATGLNEIWLGLTFVLNLVLELLGLAFGLNPFAEGQTMSHVSAAVGRLYANITDPWLSTLVVCGGIWFAYKGLVKREVAAGVAGTLAAIAMLVVGLWIVNQPRASVGQAASLSNEVALGVISAPQSGSLARPLGSYAEAMSRAWSRLVEVPFAGLDFSNLKWALGPPPPEAVEKSNEKFCEDAGTLALLAVLSQMSSEEAKQACGNFAAKRYGKPKRVIDLYLRSSPGSSAREALWNYFNGEERYQADVAAQGGDGSLTRLSMLALFALGLSGAMLLLAWLAIRLFTQAAIAFVLLLAAPFALFFPLLGDAGRRAFKTWGLTLFGAIVAKVIYAAFLSIVLLGISVLGTVDGPGGSATGFLLSCAFAWAVFLKRAELVGWLSIGEVDPAARGGFGFGQFMALRMGARVASAPARAARGAVRGAAHLGRRRAVLGGAATRETARGALQGSARALADERYREAGETVRAYEQAREGEHGSGRSKGAAKASGKGAAPVDAAAAKGASSSASGKGTAGSSAPAGAAAPSPERYEQAKQLRARAARNEVRTGDRWTERDLQRFAAEDRGLLESSRSPADHAHRIGMKRAEFEQLKGPERERAKERIEVARKRDSKRDAVASEVPGRIVGHRRQAVERARQGVEGIKGSNQRHEHLRRLRRERRAASARRNLSRGA